MMSDPHTELRQLPSLGPLFVKALLKRKGDFAEPVLPGGTLRVKMRPAHRKLQDYHKLVSWQGADVHPCWLQVRALPLQLSLLTFADFPFAVMGLIHMKNRLEQYQPVSENMSLELSCQLGGLKKHRMGWQFQMHTQAHCQQRLIWQSTATTLAPVHKISAGQSKRQPAEPPERAPQENWSLNQTLGRQYASVSGDYNPIHLYPLTARLFGFRQPIIHGMWSYARVVSSLSQHHCIADGFSSSVTFKRPLTLPGQAQLYLEHDDARDGRFELRSGEQHQVVLCGDWQPL